MSRRSRRQGPPGRARRAAPLARAGHAGAALLLAFGCVPALAQSASGEPGQQPSGTTAAGAVTLPEVSVTGEREHARSLTPAESTTTIDASEIERHQSSTVFETVKDVPGVSVDGGPRATGMKFNIRGFRGNEDVLFKIDGAVKGFEKYRFGSGVFIEPELIRSITVERGPSILTGSGAIGGAVIATTKTAADFLEPGQRFGGLVKFGYDTNSHERLRMLTVYGRPTDRADLLFSVTSRDSGDFKLANGERFPATSNKIDSSLMKLTLYPIDHLTLELSRTAFKSGPTYTPFDANSSNAFVGGYVHQQVDDETINLRFNYTPPDSWLNLRGTLAHETTDLRNQMRTGAGESSFAVPCTTDPCVWNPLGGPTGEMNDYWDYRIWTAELFNDTRYRLGNVQGVFTIGAQFVDNQRDLRRLTENPLMNLPGGRYPDGFDPQQPPGTKTSYALVAQNTFNWSNVSLTPGVRVDHYELKADGQTRTNLQDLGAPTSYSFTKTTPSVTLQWRPAGGPWYLSHRWARAFKPPLITDYFGTESASPCSGLFTPDGQRIAPNGCGDLVKPSTSLNREYTIGWAPLGRNADARSSTQARLTFYEIDTKQLVGGVYLAAVDGVIIQPYKERRRGIEFEVVHEAPKWFGQFNFSRILARRTNTLTGQAFNFTAGIPGTTTGLTLGYRVIPEKLEIGYRVRHVHDQLVLPGSTSLTASTQYCGKVTPGGVAQAAVTLQDLFATWRVHKHVNLSLSINNLTNQRWCNNGDELGNVIGLQGPGRSIRLSMTAQY